MTYCVSAGGLVECKIASLEEDEKETDDMELADMYNPMHETAMLEREKKLKEELRTEQEDREKKMRKEQEEREKNMRAEIRDEMRKEQQDLREIIEIIERNSRSL